MIEKKLFVIILSLFSYVSVDAMENHPYKRLEEIKALDRTLYASEEYIELAHTGKSEKQELVVTEILETKKQLAQFKQELDLAISEIPKLGDHPLSLNYGKSLAFHIGATQQYESKLTAASKRAKVEQIQQKVSNYSQELRKKYVMPFWNEIIFRREKRIDQ